MHVTTTGWLSILTLKFLDTSENKSITDEVASAVQRVLVSKKDTIEIINIGCNLLDEDDGDGITSSGWHTISTTSDAIRLKIIHHYDGINMQSLVEVPSELQRSLVLSVMNCLGNEYSQTALYRFIRNQPSLFEWA